jgi:DNA repair protein RecN (Recombination protein N)
MLRRLFIKDFVIVDRLELEFEAGFGTLTGETGAGKSILVDALSLALGERADAGVVRAGCDKAEVAAEFDADDRLTAWLRANDLEADGGCLLRRLVDSKGRSRAYVNGMPATLAQLKEAADFLADIHGQHAYHTLLRPEAQRRMLDAQAGLTDLARDVAAKFRVWREIREARERAALDQESLTRERELLEWQAKELETLGFDADRWQEEIQEHRRLAHAASLLEGTAAGMTLLDEGEASALAQVDEVVSRLKSVLDYDAGLRGAVELVESARIQLVEAAHALARYRERLDLEPERLTELDARLEAVTGMVRKHRVTPDELPALKARIDERLAAMRMSSDPEALARREVEARADYEKGAKRLSAGRVKTAAALSQAVSDGMQQLAMAGGRFEVALEPLPEGAACGLETVEFRVAANPGQSLRSLAKVASGGELSRIGLAIQVVASHAGDTPTLIFDEVDAGIGGRVAEIVGRMLRQLGRERQVLCVTHLPQVAARADWQWSVTKEQAGGATLCRVAGLDREGRVGEIARMLGGVKITDTTREHAREMLGG